jgi:uncharacterized protein
MANAEDRQDKPKFVGNDGTVFRCPLCQAILPHADVPTFPFCSDRCRLQDLGNWLDGKYVASRPIDPTDHLEEIPRKDEPKLGRP